jgi:hypothetical protein
MNPAGPLFELAADLCAATLACQAVAIAWCLALDFIEIERHALRKCLAIDSKAQQAPPLVDR